MSVMGGLVFFLWKRKRTEAFGGVHVIVGVP